MTLYFSADAADSPGVLFFEEDEMAVQDIVVKPITLKSRSKDRAGIFLSSPDIRTCERASTKEIFLSLLKRLNNAIA